MAKTQKILNLLAKTNAKPKEAAKSEKREKTFATTNIFYLCACSTFSVCVWSKLNWLDKTAITKATKTTYNNKTNSVKHFISGEVLA